MIQYRLASPLETRDRESLAASVVLIVWELWQHETQEHCLNVCQANMPAIKGCHDRIMEHPLCVSPVAWKTKFVNQTVPGCLGWLRLDIAIVNEEHKQAF